MKKLLPLILILFIGQINAQIDSSKSLMLQKSIYPTEINKARLNRVRYGAGGFYAFGMYNLYRVWFDYNDRSKFHLANDNGHWMQMDKIGHATTANSVSEKLYYALRWAGVDHKKATWQGGLIGLAAVTSIDVMDGFSSSWGFSPGDLLANSTGSALLIGQNLLWGEQKMIIKWTYQRTDEVKENPADLGTSWTNEWLHNYNGQTYWLTFNAGNIIKPQKTWQKVLGIAVGKGAQNMYLETRQLELDSLNGFYDRGERYHQWYLSLDIDLTHIPTKNKVLKSLFLVSRFIKLPTPTLAYNKVNGMQFKTFYF